MADIDPAKPLRDFKPKKKFFIGIDSDGCAFDTMGIKQRECFCPWMIGCFGLQPVAQAARECKEFADLFSKTRGANRHKTLKRIIAELLPSHPMVKARNFQVPQFPHYFEWVDAPDSLLSNDGLKQAIAAAANPDAARELENALEWSQRVNSAIKDIVKDMPPFPFVRETLAKIAPSADVIVVSATPCEALTREWQEHGIAKYVEIIAGQEMGKKKEHLALAAAGKYEPNNTLMLGDAPGDMKAAKVNHCLFYPVNPGSETKSWQRFHGEAFDKFITGRYAGDYERALIDEFEQLLPENPPWNS